jgi:serine/threonine-protein kinase
MATVHLGCLLGPAGFSKLVAIKCLHEQLALEKEFVSMFLDEARLASSITHPNVVATLDVVAEEGELLVVMEYVHGETLATLLRTSRLTGDRPDVAVVVRILCDALEGLHAAHVASLAGKPLNIVHRDVSPQNIMAGADGNTRVLDFGIAQAALSSRVTAAGVVKGKIAYMSPEQVQGLPVDARTDVFAAGVVLWEALTGRRLFLAANSREAAALVLTSRITPPSAFAPNLSPALDEVVLKALERDPERRFQSAHDFADALRGTAEEGSRRQVAEWVGRVARDSLSARLELLQALEASAMHTQVGAQLPLLTARTPARAAAAPGSEGTPTRATVITSVLPGPDRRRRRRWTPWWIGAAGVVLALIAAAARVEGMLNRRSHARLTPGLVAVAATALAAAPAAPGRPPRDPISPPLAAEALPLAAEALPLAAEALPLAAEALPLAAEAPPFAAKALPHPPRPLGSAARPSKHKARKAARALVPTPAPAPVVEREPPLPVASSCMPPYRVDAAGVRRIKPECL